MEFDHLFPYLKYKMEDYLDTLLTDRHSVLLIKHNRSRLPYLTADLMGPFRSTWEL